MGRDVLPAIIFAAPALGAAVAFVLSSRRRAAAAAGVAGVVTGGAAALGVAVPVLAGGVAPAAVVHGPLGPMNVTVDPLSAWFLALTGLAAVLFTPAGMAYTGAAAGGKRPGMLWIPFSTLFIGLCGLIIAHDAVLFTAAWETMSLATLFLLAFEDDRAEKRDAAWMYLMAGQLSFLPLFGLFAGASTAAGTSDFAAFTTALARPELRDWVLGAALIGFGTKLALAPLHVWIAPVYAALPGFAAALLSGAGVSAGLYGLMRVLTFVGTPSPAWAWVLIGSGLVSMLFGVLMALAERDMRRSLAYSSIENMGLVSVSLGLGLLGTVFNGPWLAVAGFAGALLHVFDHALFKPLLFLVADEVERAAGTTNLERTGGLMKRLPFMGAMAVVGCAAIAALPPLVGFGGEFLVYAAAFHGTLFLRFPYDIPLVGVIAGIGLAGGLVVGAFARWFGIAFLGTPRAPLAADSGPTPFSVRLSAAAAATAIVAGGAGFPWLLRAAALPAAQATGYPGVVVESVIHDLTGTLTQAGIVGGLTVVTAAALWALRGGLLAGRSVRTGPTWGCGYLAPTPRLQYTASSFSQPVTDLFRPLISGAVSVEMPSSLFPEPGRHATRYGDAVLTRFFVPVFFVFETGFGLLRRMQHGYLRWYVLYIIATLLALIAWKAG